MSSAVYPPNPRSERRSYPFSDSFTKGSALTLGPVVGPHTVLLPRKLEWMLPIYLRPLTPNLTPTDPNRGRLGPTRLDEDLPKIPVWQGILRHQPAPGRPSAVLEQNPAYGTAQAHR